MTDKEQIVYDNKINWKMTDIEQIVYNNKFNWGDDIAITCLRDDEPNSVIVDVIFQEHKLSKEFRFRVKLLFIDKTWDEFFFDNWGLDILEKIRICYLLKRDFFMGEKEDE